MPEPGGSPPIIGGISLTGLSPVHVPGGRFGLNIGKAGRLGLLGGLFVGGVKVALPAALSAIVFCNDSLGTVPCGVFVVRAMLTHLIFFIVYVSCRVGCPAVLPHLNNLRHRRVSY